MEPSDSLPSTKLTTRSETEISEAIRDCAGKCIENGDPRGCAEAYAIDLIAHGWTAADAQQVQVGSLMVLARITGDDSLLPDPSE